MSFEFFLQRLDKLNQIVTSNELLQGIEPDDKSIQSSETFTKEKARFEKKDRLLKIGILGRVNAGKSSFLNALLFNGESILPKAATPMTAALTVLEFSENSSLNMEFYSETDFKFIKKQADKYEKELKNKTEEIFKRLEKESTKVLNEKEQSQMREKARNQALDEFKRDDKFNKMHTCYEQNELIEKSALNLSELEKHKEFQGSLSEIQTKLKDYVGSSGKFMPFTKSITLRLDNEFLKMSKSSTPRDLTTLC